MTIAELRELFEYNRWAHEKTLRSAAMLGPEKYAESTGSVVSLRPILETLVSDEFVWLARWEGHSLAESPDYGECADVIALMERWKPLSRRQARFIESLVEDDLGNLISIRLSNGIETVQSLGDTLTYVVNQATHLRGGAAVLIRQLGGDPPAVDMFTYRLESGSDDSDATTVP